MDSEHCRVEREGHVLAPLRREIDESYPEAGARGFAERRMPVDAGG